MDMYLGTYGKKKLNMGIPLVLKKHQTMTSYLFYSLVDIRPEWPYIVKKTLRHILLIQIHKTNVCSTEKLTKRSTVLLLRLVSFSAEQTLEVSLWI